MHRGHVEGVLVIETKLWLLRRVLGGGSSCSSLFFFVGKVTVGLKSRVRCGVVMWSSPGRETLPVPKVRIVFIGLHHRRVVSLIELPA